MSSLCLGAVVPPHPLPRSFLPRPRGAQRSDLFVGVITGISGHALNDLGPLGESVLPHGFTELDKQLPKLGLPLCGQGLVQDAQTNLRDFLVHDPKRRQ